MEIKLVPHVEMSVEDKATIIKMDTLLNSFCSWTDCDTCPLRKSKADGGCFWDDWHRFMEKNGMRD